MSIKTEIARIESAKDSISSAVSRAGVSVPSSAKIDSYAGYVNTAIDNLTDFRVSGTTLVIPQEVASVSGTTLRIGLE